MLPHPTAAMPPISLLHESMTITAPSAITVGSGIYKARYVVQGIVVHTARGTTARYEARFFSPTRARPGTEASGPGLAWPEGAGRAWALPQACGPAQHGPLQNRRPAGGPACSSAAGRSLLPHAAHAPSSHPATPDSPPPPPPRGPEP